jgi:thiamine biosynthesis lipoprotein
MKHYQYSCRSMGTIFRARVYLSDNDPVHIFGQISDELKRLESKYSRYNPLSLLSTINKNSGLNIPTEIDSETYALLNYAKTCYELSEGSFDITSGIFRKIWKFGSDGNIFQLPKETEVSNLLPFVDFKRIIYDKTSIKIPKGMEIDLGGIVKEYAVDCLGTKLINMKVTSGLLEFGGDIFCIGPHPDGTPWKVGIQDPFLKNTPIAVASLHHGALASSGNYERCQILDDKLVHHIIDAKNGYPVEGLVTCSVFAPHCVVAGSLATIGMLKGKTATEWLRNQHAEYFAVDNTGKVDSNIKTLEMR